MPNSIRIVPALHVPRYDLTNFCAVAPQKIRARACFDAHYDKAMVGRKSIIKSNKKLPREQRAIAHQGTSSEF